MTTCHLVTSNGLAGSLTAVSPQSSSFFLLREISHSLLVSGQARRAGTIKFKDIVQAWCVLCCIAKSLRGPGRPVLPAARLSLWRGTALRSPGPEFGDC